MSKKILMIVTNAARMNGHETGLWLSEFVEPSVEFGEAGYEVTAASPLGGRPPIDENSYSNQLPEVWDGGNGTDQPDGGAGGSGSYIVCRHLFMRRTRDHG